MASSDTLNTRLVIWNVKSGKRIHSISRSFIGGNSLAFTSDGAYLLTSTAKPDEKSSLKSLSLIDVASGQIVKDINGPDEHPTNAGSNYAQMFAVSPFGDYVAAITRNQNTEFLNVYSQTSWQLLKSRKIEQLNFGIAYGGPNGELALSGYGGRLEICAGDSGDAITVLQSHPRRGGALAFSIDKKWLAVSDNPGLSNDTRDPESIKLFDTRTWQSSAGTKAISGSYVGAAALAPSPDGRFLAAMGFDGIVRVWDPTNLELITNVDDGDKGGVAVAFSPDSRYLAIGRDRRISVVRVGETK